MYKPLLIIVDQNLETLAETERLFADRFECVGIASPEDALESIRHRGPAAVVVDFPMPLRAGGCLSAAIKDDPGTSDVPVVAYSSWDFANTRNKAVSIGCAAFVARSAEASELEAAVERAATGESVLQV